jgi:hypothetical protein
MAYRLLRTAMVLAIIVCGSCTRKLPEGVTEIYVAVSMDQGEEWAHLFRHNYHIPSEGMTTSTQPELGVDYDTYLSFQGRIIPLAVRSNGEFAIPDRYFVMRKPFLTVTRWEPGMHRDVGSNSRYFYKLRPDEVGLVFVLISYEWPDVWVYPSDLVPLRTEDMPRRPRASGQLVPTVVIPDISGLLHIERGGSEWIGMFPEAIRRHLGDVRHYED